MVQASCRQVADELPRQVARYFSLFDTLWQLSRDMGDLQQPKDFAQRAKLDERTVAGYFAATESRPRRVPQKLLHLENLIDQFDLFQPAQMAVPGRTQQRDELIKAWQQARLAQAVPLAERGPAAGGHLVAAPQAASSTRVGEAGTTAPRPATDIGAIAAFAPAALIGRDAELQLLHKAWADVCNQVPNRLRVMVLHTLGGGGKTSLVARWTCDLADAPQTRAGRPMLAYTFYAQGTGEQLATSSDLLLNEALAFFGQDPARTHAMNGAAKAREVARLARACQALVVLDGTEPLQFAPSSASPGKLKDTPLGVLLKELAADDGGLCIVTTRQAIADLEPHRPQAVQQHALQRLSDDNAVRMLRSLAWGQGAGRVSLHGPARDFLALARDTQGHALTLHLIGSYLLQACAGDIRQRHRVRLTTADEQVATVASRGAGRHAFRVMAAYEQWFDQDGPAGQRALVVLRALGLFDRPASAACLQALLAPPAIVGLTEPLLDPDDALLALVCRRLEAAGLVTCRPAPGTGLPLLDVDAHPLIREYFAERLRQQPDGVWMRANARLYEHLRSVVGPEEPERQVQLEPLYQAVVHGCRSGQHQSAFDDVFWARICRGDRQLSTGRFGAINHDISALAAFFDRPWDRIAPGLDPGTQARICSTAGFRLRTAARFTEAAPLMARALQHHVALGAWRDACAEANNLSVLWMHAGALDRSVAYARQAVAHATQLGDRQLMSDRLATLGDPLIQLGPTARDEARAVFLQAEALQAECDSERHLLYSTKGYRYHEFLLDHGACDEVIDRVTRIAGWTTERYRILDTGLNLLMRGRAHLLRARASGQAHELALALRHTEAALNEVVASGFQENLAKALIQHAECVSASHPERARADLDEAWEIALAGPMPLFQADILLSRVRLFGGGGAAGRPSAYAWDGAPLQDLQAARQLIERHHYGRRLAELAELETRAAVPVRRRRG